MIIHKFGGTSVGDADRFSNVADIIKRHHQEPGGPSEGESVVVLSAMSGVTNQLIAGARAAADGKASVCSSGWLGRASRRNQPVAKQLAPLSRRGASA